MFIQTILGVDFSGAALAGLKIWLARATIEDGVLRVHKLQRAADLPNSSPAREKALPTLVETVCGFEAPICGFDFPFSLTHEVIGDDWLRWLQTEVVPCPDADTFKATFPDARRRCDMNAKTPFSPLNLRLYRQTFHGLRDVLAPLAQCGARVLPMQDAVPGAARLLEICPASLLKREKLYLSYKGKSAAQWANRELIWNTLRERGPFAASAEIEKVALSDSEGDALDAVLAAVCVQRALRTPQNLRARDEVERREGRVYF